MTKTGLAKLAKNMWADLIKPGAPRVKKIPALDFVGDPTFRKIERNGQPSSAIWKRKGWGPGPREFCTRAVDKDGVISVVDMYDDRVIPHTTDTPGEYYNDARHPNVTKLVQSGSNTWEKIQAGMYIGILVVLVITVGIIIVILLGGSGENG